MDINLWDRVTTAVRERYRRTALAQYGAGLGCDCGECDWGPDVVVPLPRQERASDVHQPAR